MSQRNSVGGTAVRPVAGTDIGLLAALHADIFAGATAGESWDREAIARILAMPGADGLVALRADDREPIGLALYRVAADEAEILSIGVLRSARRLGAGRVLLQAVLAAVGAVGARRLYLEVATHNRAAQDLYRSEGLRVVGRRPRYYRAGEGAPVDALVFARSL